MKRALSLTLCLLLLLTACGSAETADTAADAVNTDTLEIVETETEEAPDLPADLTFGGATFTFGVAYRLLYRRLLPIRQAICPPVRFFRGFRLSILALKSTFLCGHISIQKTL